MRIRWCRSRVRIFHPGRVYGRNTFPITQRKTQTSEIWELVTTALHCVEERDELPLLVSSRRLKSLVSSQAHHNRDNIVSVRNNID